MPAERRPRVSHVTYVNLKTIRNSGTSLMRLSCSVCKLQKRKFNYRIYRSATAALTSRRRCADVACVCARPTFCCADSQSIARYSRHYGMLRSFTILSKSTMATRLEHPCGLQSGSRAWKSRMYTSASTTSDYSPFQNDNRHSLHSGGDYGIAVLSCRRYTNICNNIMRTFDDIVDVVSYYYTFIEIDVTILCTHV